MMTPKPCRSCKAPILLVRKGENRTSWMPVASDRVDPTQVYDVSSVRALDGEHAYMIGHLRERLEMRLAFDHDGPSDVYDYPWHLVHLCESGDR